MKEDDEYKKLNNYYDKEELWKKIYFCSLIFSVIIVISSFIFNLQFKYSIYIYICCIVWIVISFILQFTYHNLYNSLLIDIAKKNNTLNKIISLNNIGNETKSNLKINYVMEGKYKNRKILGGSSLRIDVELCPLNKRYISSYTVIDETNKDQYSFWKGALGVALLGGVGAVAGIGGKKKKEYLIAIEWIEGEKSLICIDEEYYKVFVRSMF